jgi:PAS domain S-box-containing protein/putative nucleotidyltransferase with HDIG domain
MKSDKTNRATGSNEKIDEHPPSQDDSRVNTKKVLNLLSELTSTQTELEKHKEELSRIRKELQESHDKIDRYQSIVTNLSEDAIVTTDKELNIIKWNKIAETMFGWQGEEILGENVSSKVRSKVLGFLSDEEVMKSITENSTWVGNTAVSRKDGSRLDSLASISILWDDNGNFNGIVAVYHEIAAHNESRSLPDSDKIDLLVKERTEELTKANRILQQELSLHKQDALLSEESEGKNKDLVDNIKLGIFRCTPGLKGKFLEVNKAMEEITGYSRDELFQIDVDALYPDIDDQYPLTHDVTITDWKVIKELSLKKKNGDNITVSISIIAIRFDSGSIQFFDGILDDITERKRVQLQVQHSLDRLQKTIEEIIQAMAYIGEVRDPYTAGHQRRVAQLTCAIARSMGLDSDEYEGLTMAAFVHDIGKILIPADILSKPGNLTKPEFDIIKDHTRIGYEILKNIEFPWPIANIVLQHHERMNGSGYPSGISGDKIILEARILAVADVVEAMSSHRPYRPALGVEKALAEINMNRSTLYDAEVVDTCLKIFADTGFNFN